MEYISLFCHEDPRRWKVTQEGWCNPSSFSAEEYMETLQLRLDEDSTNGFFEAVFFLEDPVFWEVCHLGLFEVKHTYVIHGSTGYSFVCSRSKRVDRCAVFWAWGVSGNRRPDVVGDHTHVACLLLPFAIFLHCSSSTSRWITMSCTFWLTRYVEDIYIRVLLLLVSILNPYHL